MTRNTRGTRDDYWFMRHQRKLWDDRTVEALLRVRNTNSLSEPAAKDQALLDTLAALRSFAHETPPTPSAALAAVMGGAVALNPSDAPAILVRKAPARRRLRIAVVLCTAGLSLGTLATAANALPSGFQRTAASVLNALTPFEFPTAKARPVPTESPVRESPSPLPPAPPSSATEDSTGPSPDTDSGTDTQDGTDSSTQDSHNDQPSATASTTPTGSDEQDNSPGSTSGASTTETPPGETNDETEPHAAGSTESDPTSIDSG